MKTLITCALVASIFTASAVTAEQIPFNSKWKEQKFSLFSKNKYGFKGNTLAVQSDGSVSMAYLPVPEALWDSARADWSWRVDDSVPATDLRQKGGDDRNLALYFVFAPKTEAQALKGKGISKLLSNSSVKVLVYVWGGNHGRGKILPSPYLNARGKTVVLRNAGKGSHTESVNLAGDYKRAFGGTAGVVVGLAVSADSDDTDTAIRGSVMNLSLN